MHKFVFFFTRNKTYLFVKEAPLKINEGGRKSFEKSSTKHGNQRKNRPSRRHLPNGTANECTQPTWKAVGYKGRLGCIEILKAKAAIASDRFRVNKVQQGAEWRSDEEEEEEEQIIALTRGGAQRGWTITWISVSRRRNSERRSVKVTAGQQFAQSCFQWRNWTVCSYRNAAGGQSAFVLLWQFDTIHVFCFFFFTTKQIGLLALKIVPPPQKEFALAAVVLPACPEKSAQRGRWSSAADWPLASRNMRYKYSRVCLVIVHKSHKFVRKSAQTVSRLSKLKVRWIKGPVRAKEMKRQPVFSSPKSSHWTFFFHPGVPQLKSKQLRQNCRRFETLAEDVKKIWQVGSRETSSASLCETGI